MRISKYWAALRIALGLACLLPAVIALEAVQSSDSTVRVFTHGEGTYAQPDETGKLAGPGMDVLRCAMDRLKRAYEVKTVAMVRVDRMIEDGLIDIWFPSYNKGEIDRHRKIIGVLGELRINWILRQNMDMDPFSKMFKDTAKVTAFPGSTPERMLQRNGYRYIQGTDDTDRMFLMLYGGKVDAILSADFRAFLSPRFKDAVKDVRVIEYARYPAGFELFSPFIDKEPEFEKAFATALDGC
ncbi:hypothetical protein GCM10017044_11700 [Kordiimonas sediminis]|uniref:Solute-binding protein family 3/N-terminal domain-containing protein n=1 Tax=Kordiimonas sediminis TaxID=1735581 RepID=A0A919AQ48_9PROT|nr:ABC transporter substrate-binding protein [Kordiimonas sediminis]GHF18817.1 hypothetical protein GCM10017044_11700 [Kordiimonas sediminis]